MLAIVSAKPRQFTIVREVPREASGAFCATSVEKSGESATTTIPQNTRKTTSSTGELPRRNIGDTKQHTPDSASAAVATGRGPTFWESSPLAMQAKHPTPIMKKDSK